MFSLGDRTYCVPLVFRPTLKLMLSEKSSVRKVVFPAAGLGTRFLPATKSQPKEMLSVVDKPIIQYGVEEAVASGIEDVVIVTAEGKSTMEDHFDVSRELEKELEARGKKRELEVVHGISNLANISYVLQTEALGLGHAVGVARNIVGRDPFAVSLPDDIIHSTVPCLKQLIDVHRELGGAVIAVMEVPRERISAYGAIDGEPVEFDGTNDRLFRVSDVVEKPPVEDAPSNLAIIGRYVFPPEIFDCLDSIKPGAGGELQLTDAIKALIRSQPVYAYKFEGTRYDAGDKLGFLQATVEYGLRHEELGREFGAYLKTLKL